MAGIREELTLIDKFSSVFDRFINMGNRAASQASAVESSTNRMANSAADASQRLSNIGSGGAPGIQSATQTFDKATESINYYKKMLAETERQMDSVTKKLYMADVMPGSRRQQGNVDVWRKQSDALEAEAQRLKAAIASASGEAARLAPAINNAVDPTKAMHNEFKGIASTVMKITALLGGVYAGKKFLELGFKTDTSERMFQARFGDQEIGSAAFQHYKDMANHYGFNQEDVFAGVKSFMGMTTVPKQLDELTMLAKTMAVFDTTGQGLKGAQFSLQEAMSGDFMSLRRRFNIGKAQIEASGALKAAKAGDMEGFIEGMKKLLQMRNMGGEAFNNLMKSPRRQLEAFTNRWHNSMANMAQAVVLRLLPAINLISSLFFDADGKMTSFGENFIGALGFVAGALAYSVAGVLWLIHAMGQLWDAIDPLQPIIEWIFFTLLITGAYVAAAALWAMVPPLAAQALAWLALNWPILLVVATIIGLLALILKYPDAFGIVVGAVFAFGAAFVDVFRSIANGWANTYNFIADGVSKLSNGKIQLQHLDKIEYINPIDAYNSGKSWGTNAATQLGETLKNIVPSMPNISTAPFDNFPGATNLDNVGKVGKVGKIDHPVKLSDEDLKMLLDIADRDYVNNINLTQLTPSVHVEVNTGGGAVDEDAVAERIKHLLIEQAASSTNLV